MKAIASYGGDLETSIEKACNAKGVGEIEKAFMTCGDLVVYEQSHGSYLGWYVQWIGNTNTYR